MRAYRRCQAPQRLMPVPTSFYTGKEAAAEERSTLMPPDSSENVAREHFPYPSRRMPLYAARGVVATSAPLAAQAGLQMLQRGGTAVDAAIATAVALTVVEPTSNGIGAAAFALVWDRLGLHGHLGPLRA